MLYPQKIDALEIVTARGKIEINNGDTVQRRSMWTGQIKDLKDVTFIGWNFTRKEPHSVVFINCENLTFVSCNLKNVELQEDFTIDGSLIVHEERYEIIGIKYRKQETKNNKTRIFRMHGEEPILMKVEDTLNEKKIKVKYVHPNTRVISNLNAVAVPK